jgi:hypothetical protein
MLYYELQTEQDALLTESWIVSNTALWVSQNRPELFEPTGPKLRSVNAKDGSVVYGFGFTERWAVPQQTAAGTWVIPVPQASDSSFIPVEVATEGVNAPTIEDPVFSDPEEVF